MQASPLIEPKQTEGRCGPSPKSPCKLASILGTLPQHDHIPTKQGWISKKAMLTRYDRHFMELKGDALVLSKTSKKRVSKQKQSIVRRVFDLSAHVYRVSAHQNRKFYLFDDTENKKRTFRAASECERDEWVEAIRRSICHGRILRQSSARQLSAYYGTVSA